METREAKSVTSKLPIFQAAANAVTVRRLIVRQMVPKLIAREIAVHFA